MGFGQWDHGALKGEYLVLRAWRGGRTRGGRLMDWDAWARRAEAALAFEGRGPLARPVRARRGVRRPEHAEHHATCGRCSAAPPRSSRTGARRSRRSAAATTGRCSSGSAGRRTPGVATDDPVGGTPIEMHGASIVEVDADGLVTKWTDYLDRKEPEVQLPRRRSRSAPATGSRRDRSPGSRSD